MKITYVAYVFYFLYLNVFSGNPLKIFGLVSRIFWNKVFE